MKEQAHEQLDRQYDQLHQVARPQRAGAGARRQRLPTWLPGGAARPVREVVMIEIGPNLLDLLSNILGLIGFVFLLCMVWKATR